MGVRSRPVRQGPANLGSPSGFDKAGAPTRPLSVVRAVSSTDRIRGSRLRRHGGRKPAWGNRRVIFRPTGPECPRPPVFPPARYARIEVEASASKSQVKVAKWPANDLCAPAPARPMPSSLPPTTRSLRTRRMPVDPCTSLSRCPRCGLPRAAGAANPFRCGACGFTYYFNTASAVAASRGCRGTAASSSAGPGNRPEGNLPCPVASPILEKLREHALRREIHEELGLELGPLTYVGSWPNRYHANGFVVPVLDLFFHARVVSPDAPRSRR